MFIIIVFFLLSVFGRDRNRNDFKNSTSSLEFVDKYQLKIPIASEEIELSLNEFLSLFVLDNAPYGIHRYKSFRCALVRFMFYIVCLLT